MSRSESTGSEAMREQFATLYAFGTPPTEALIDAGYGTRSRSLALQLLQLDDVQAQVNKTREWIASKVAKTKENILEQLERDRELAFKTDNPAAAVSASSAMAKIIGLLDPDSAGRAPKRIVIEWDDGSEHPSS